MMLADYISRIHDFDDWMVDPNFFNFVNTTWGPHTVDCFAASHNSQIAVDFGAQVLRLWILSQSIG